MTRVQEKQHTAYKTLKEEFGYRNTMESPKLLKVVISTGIGKIQDKNKIKVIEDRLAKITGQKAAPRGAKKSIASFKVRQGDVVGYQATLRGPRMWDFLERLIAVALPRTKDFRGLSEKSIDPMGNLTVGIREHTIFPETSDEDLRDVFGFSVTVVTSARSKVEAKRFLESLGFPFRKSGKEIKGR